MRDTEISAAVGGGGTDRRVCAAITFQVTPVKEVHTDTKVGVRSGQILVGDPHFGGSGDN